MWQDSGYTQTYLGVEWPWRLLQWNILQCNHQEVFCYGVSVHGNAEMSPVMETLLPTSFSSMEVSGVESTCLLLLCIFGASGRGIDNMSCATESLDMQSSKYLLLQNLLAWNHHDVFCYRVSGRGIVKMHSARTCIIFLRKTFSNFWVWGKETTVKRTEREKHFTLLMKYFFTETGIHIGKKKGQDDHRKFALFFCQMSNSYFKPWTISRPEKVYVSTWKLISLHVFRNIKFWSQLHKMRGFPSSARYLYF